MRIKDMLKEEIKKSADFQKRNFGLRMGDGYPEMVKELCRSSTAVAHLCVGFVKTLAAAPSCGSGMPQATDADAMQEAMLERLPVFESQFDMMYWGIQIGRRMQREEDAALAGIAAATPTTDEGNQ